MRHRRKVLQASGAAVSAGLAGCVDSYFQALLGGCSGMNRYDIKLSEVSPSRARNSSALINYQELSREEKHLIQQAKSAEDGFYSECHSDLSDVEREGALKLGNRIRDKTSEYTVFLQIREQYYQLGFIAGDLYYAKTDHATVPERTPTATESPGSVDR